VLQQTDSTHIPTAQVQ